MQSLINFLETFLKDDKEKYFLAKVPLSILACVMLYLGVTSNFTFSNIISYTLGLWILFSLVLVMSGYRFKK